LLRGGFEVGLGRDVIAIEDTPRPVPRDAHGDEVGCAAGRLTGAHDGAPATVEGDIAPFQCEHFSLLPAGQVRKRREVGHVGGQVPADGRKVGGFKEGPVCSRSGAGWPAISAQRRGARPAGER
jgi:hypothetical protein